MNRKRNQKAIVEADTSDWNPQNRRPLFKTLKRGQQSTTDSKRISKYSPKGTSSIENQRTENQMHQGTTCYNAACEDLFQRSVFSLEHRTHRTNLIPDPMQPDDIPYVHSQKKIKNYKPLKERVTESAENKKAICNKYYEEREAKEKDECTFTPIIVSKQTNHTHDLLSTTKKTQKEAEKEKIEPVINQKSKEIAERLTNCTTIYSRQSSKIYHNPKTPNENEKKTLKMPQKEIDKLIDRLTSQQQDSSSDSLEIDKFRNTTIDKKDIDRLVLDSVHKNQLRSKYRADSNTYKPRINEKSVELAKTISPKPRDLYMESLVEYRKKERKAAAIKNYKEMQEMQDCIPRPKPSQSPSYLNKVNEMDLSDIHEKIESNEIKPLEPYIFKEIDPKPFSFDKISKKEKNA